jgi:hypothetical protein
MILLQQIYEKMIFCKVPCKSNQNNQCLLGFLAAPTEYMDFNPLNYCMKGRVVESVGPRLVSKWSSLSRRTQDRESGPYIIWGQQTVIENWNGRVQVLLT